MNNLPEISLEGPSDPVGSPAPSPFIEGTNLQFALDSTSLGAAKKCLKFYKYTIIDGLRKKNESVHLRWGGEFASALEFHHKRIAEGLPYEEALDASIQDTFIRTHEWHPDHPKKNKDTLLRSIIWYLDAYKDDPAKTYILSNGKPAVELSFKLELPWDAAPGQPYILCGHLDKVVDYGGDIFIMDQKSTGGNLGAFYFQDFNPHGQMSGYTFAGRVLFNIPVAGVIIDAVKVVAGYTEFARGFTMRTQSQLDEWITDTRQWTEIIKFSVEHNYWPMNDSSCHQYGGCAFREVCSQDPAVRNSYLSTYFEKRIWNPLIPRT